MKKRITYTTVMATLLHIKSQNNEDLSLQDISETMNKLKNIFTIYDTNIDNNFIKYITKKYDENGNIIISYSNNPDAKEKTLDMVDSDVIDVIEKKYQTELTVDEILATYLYINEGTKINSLTEKNLKILTKQLRKKYIITETEISENIKKIIDVKETETGKEFVLNENKNWVVKETGIMTLLSTWLNNDLHELLAASELNINKNGIIEFYLDDKLEQTKLNDFDIVLAKLLVEKNRVYAEDIEKELAKYKLDNNLNILGNLSNIISSNVLANIENNSFYLEVIDNGYSYNKLVEYLEKNNVQVNYEIKEGSKN